MVGTGVESIHCAIENKNGVVTLHPINGNTAVDGVPINSPVRLAQGKTLTQIRMAKYNSPIKSISPFFSSLKRYLANFPN